MIEIRRNTPTLALLKDYATIPISFHGHSHFEVRSEGGRWKLTESPVTPFFKDYDTLEHPTLWATSFDLSNWLMLGAFEDGKRIGGAIVAARTLGVNMLEGREDLAVIWDIRVHPDCRKRNVGSQLLAEALDWSKAQGCKELKLETQQVNVAACKFYAKMGFDLRHVRENQYPDLPEEIQLVWYHEL